MTKPSVDDVQSAREWMQKETRLTRDYDAWLPTVLHSYGTHVRQKALHDAKQAASGMTYNGDLYSRTTDDMDYGVARAVAAIDRLIESGSGARAAVQPSNREGKG